jgi:hypothetical protein
VRLNPEGLEEARWVGVSLHGLAGLLFLISHLSVFVVVFVFVEVFREMKRKLLHRVEAVEDRDEMDGASVHGGPL